MQTLKTGVLVIGGGGAAARTAWEASMAGAEVTLLTKGSFGVKADVWPKCNADSPRNMIEVLELQNLLTLAELEAAVCLNRQESRGPHYRSDFPVQDDQHWLKSITVKKIEDRMQIDTLALDPRWQSQGDEKMGYWG